MGSFGQTILQQKISCKWTFKNKVLKRIDRCLERNMLDTLCEVNSDPERTEFKY
jgi:hypothetical protein